MSAKNYLWLAILLALAVAGRQFFGAGPFGAGTANLMQGLSMSTEIKYMVAEHWSATGALPCNAKDFDIDVASGYGQAVLAAIDVTDCGQITLQYNEESGMDGQRLVLQAAEFEGARGLELTWSCWTPDIPDIDTRIGQCHYEERELAAIEIPEPLPETTKRSMPEIATAQPDATCSTTPAIYRPVFTDDVQRRAPMNQLVRYAPQRRNLVFFTEVIGAAGTKIIHKWYIDDAVIAEQTISVVDDRWPTWSSQRVTSTDTSTVRVEVYDDDACMIGQASIQSGEEAVAEAPQPGGWMRPQQALEVTLAKPQIDYANNASRARFVDDLTDDGDTLLLAAIRRGDSQEALTLINRVAAPELPPTIRPNEADAIRGRHYGRADPFLRDVDGVTPINLAHQLGHETIVEALIQSAITVHINVSRKRRKEVKFTDTIVDSLMVNDGGLARFDDGDTPLHRAVRTNNERAVMTMLRLT